MRKRDLGILLLAGFAIFFSLQVCMWMCVCMCLFPSFLSKLKNNARSAELFGKQMLIFFVR